MRALCESCDQPQPRDWRSGDLCVHCGQAVREEARCHWCAKWGPKGKFCRKCGSVSVPPERYGAARMLKEMGASVFEIPKLIVELDPELLDTHEAIYSTHAAAANRHVDDALWLGGFLYQKHWAEELAETLIPQLPWPEATLKAHSRPGPGAVPDLDRARLLSETSPVETVRCLAQLVRVHLGDYRNEREAMNLVYSPDERMAAEAALQFAGWRSLLTRYLEMNRYDLAGVLAKSPLPAHAAPRLAALAGKHDARPEYSLTGDADTDFLIHVLDGDLQALTEALRSADAGRAYAAAAKLVQLGYADRIGPVLGRIDETLLAELLQDIARAKRPAPALLEELFLLVARSQNHRVARAAVRVICLSPEPAVLLRLFDEAGGESDTLQMLLLSAAPPETLYEIGWRLVKEDRFSAEQWGMDAAAKPGRMPEMFVRDMYGQASDRVRSELLRFGEKQVEQREFVEDTEIEPFLTRQCFRPGTPEVVKQAWSVMSRIQRRRQVGRDIPCAPTLENLARIGDLREFLAGLAWLMANWRPDEFVSFRDEFSRFLSAAGPEFFEAAAKYPHDCRTVIEAAPSADPYGTVPRFAQRLQAALH